MTKEKYRRLKWTAVATLALMLAPVLLQAQDLRLVAQIPFAFHIGEQTLPAGEYSIARGRDPSVLSISDRKGHAMVTLVMQAVRPVENESKLIFNKYGDEYFLSEVRWMASPNAIQFRPSSVERELAKNAAPQQVATTRKRP